MHLTRGSRLIASTRFPDISYFRDPVVQSALTTVLYLHSVQHPQIGYRQGMHELLAPLLLALDYDSLERSSLPTDEPMSEDTDKLLQLCDRKWIAADAFTLFGIVMAHASEWYEWREPVVKPIKGQLDTTPYVSPIVQVCSKIHSEYLKNTDPVLYSRLQEVGVEPQIYGM